MHGPAVYASGSGDDKDVCMAQQCILMLMLNMSAEPGSS